MPFSSYSSGLPSLENITVNDVEIPETHTIKYLGIEIDGHLKWKEHINNLVKKLRGFLYQFKIMARYVTSTKHLKMIYCALVESQINYGIIGWGGVYSSHLQKLQVVQKWILKIIFKKKLTFPTEQIYSLSGVFDPRQLYTQKILHRVFMNKIEIKLPEHEHNTRNRERNYRTDRSQKRIGQRSFMYLAPRLYKRLPDDLRIIDKTRTFKIKLKIWITENKDLIKTIID